MSMTPEKLKALFGDLGKATLRGVRKCPQCGTMNGTRGVSCKNKNCNVIFKEKERRKVSSAEAVKVITGSTVQVFSIRLRDRGPDYRGFVQLPLVQDMDGNPAENVDPGILAQAAKCYVDSCNRGTSLMQGPGCPHIRAAIECAQEATPLTLKNSVLNSLQVDNETKQSIWLLATETSGPLVQRVSKNMMVCKCKPVPKHPLGFLHFSFYETTRNRSEPEYKFQCTCKAFKYKPAVIKDETGPKRCVHYYACISAFASDEKLTEEFQHFFSPDIITVSESELVLTDSNEQQVVTNILPVETTISISEEPEAASVEVVTVIDEDSMLIGEEAIKRPKLDESGLLLEGSDTIAQASSALLTLQEATTTTGTMPTTTNSPTVINASSVGVATGTTSIASPVPVPGSLKRVTPVKQVSAQSRAANRDSVSYSALTAPNYAKKALTGPPDEGSVILTFQQWLGSVTERINQTMHYQFDGSPDPLVFHASQKFFDCLQHRISAGNRKKRLPNSTTGFIRKDALPLGTFTKYTWHITNILHVKQIFDTPGMPLEITRSFVENRDGTFDLYEGPSRAHVENMDFSGQKQTPIRPFELKTYLKVGNTAPDQKEPTPFIIEWIPDILPHSRIGELRIKFEYGHQRNGHIERRMAPLDINITGVGSVEPVELHPMLQPTT